MKGQTPLLVLDNNKFGGSSFTLRHQWRLFPYRAYWIPGRIDLCVPKLGVAVEFFCLVFFSHIILEVVLVHTRSTWFGSTGEKRCGIGGAYRGRLVHLYGVLV